eukprot:1353001-Amorphochlora_amoeboformis.AAC.1
MSKFLQQRQMEARLTAEGEDFVFMSAFTYSDSKRKIVLVLGSKNYFEFDGEGQKSTNPGLLLFSKPLSFFLLDVKR